MIRLTRMIPVFPMNERDATIDFYSKKLGFNIEADYGQYLIFEKDGFRLHCSLNQTWLDPKTSNSMAYIFLENVDKLFEKCLTEKIVHPNSWLKNQDYGLRDFAVLDPTGNLITFGEPF